MQYLVTSSEMKEYDNHTIEDIGIPALVLMERAALSVREEIRRRSSVEGRSLKSVSEQTVLIVSGCGNNGADGLALARLLAEDGYRVSVYECGNLAHATESYQKQRKILGFYDICFLDNTGQFQRKYDFVVDGIFGVGLSRTVNESYGKIIQKMNELKGLKVAIDIPSGIDGTTGEVKGCAFLADVTVTFGFGKRGLYLFPGAEYAGKVIIAPIGIDERSFFGHIPEMYTYTEVPQTLLPERRRDGNKGTFGKVLVIAGWEKMAGAAIMAAKAVLKNGAGMVKVFCSEANRSILQCAIPEAMYGNHESLTQDLHWADVIVAGPGLGKSEEAGCVLKTILKETDLSGKPLLLDADALNLIAERKELQDVLRERIIHQSLKDEKNSPVIMTPHMGELSRLSGYEISYIKSHTTEVAKEVSLNYDSIIVCKDARTLVYAKGQPIYLNVTGNSGMATAGSGDVLSGIIGALLAQGMDAYKAACVGVYLHGAAGDKAAVKETEYGVTATDIIEQL